MRTTVALFAHVDAGKTTLSEAILLYSGAIRRAGGVDAGTTALDTDPIERLRGITIYASQADFCHDGRDYTLIDTPGHVDFAAEAARVMPVLDVAVLLVDGTAGATAHTASLYRQLRARHIPVLLALTKADRSAFDAASALASARRRLGVKTLPLTALDPIGDAARETLAEADDDYCALYLAGEDTPASARSCLRAAAASGALLPAVSVSGMTGDGIGLLLDLLGALTEGIALDEAAPLAAYCYQVRADDLNRRACAVRVLGGAILPRMEVVFGEERFKIQEIRRYFGERWRAIPEARAGDAVAIVGVPAQCGDRIVAGADGCAVAERTADGALGAYPAALRSRVSPEPPSRIDALRDALRVLTVEEPSLNATPDGQTAVSVELSGRVQMDVLAQTLAMRFHVDARFDPPTIRYGETVAEPARGVGHYEPLRHYAEVHLLLAPGLPGEGVRFSSVVPVDELARNWQRLIRTHALECAHPGVLTGAPLADVRVILLGGRAHVKHTEGGDFRQATRRAIRQALRGARCILLEPRCLFEITVPTRFTGRVLSDMAALHAVCEPTRALGEDALIRGDAPVSTMLDYPLTLAQITRGEGAMLTQPAAPRPCHDAEAVIAAAAYDPDADAEHPAWSVFCEHGAGFAVPWAETPAHAHVPIPDARVEAALALAAAPDFSDLIP